MSLYACHLSACGRPIKLNFHSTDQLRPHLFDFRFIMRSVLRFTHPIKIRRKNECCTACVTGINFLCYEGNNGVSLVPSQTITFLKMNEQLPRAVEPRQSYLADQSCQPPVYFGQQLIHHCVMHASVRTHAACESRRILLCAGLSWDPSETNASAINH